MTTQYIIKKNKHFGFEPMYKNPLGTLSENIFFISTVEGVLLVFCNVKVILHSHNAAMVDFFKTLPHSHSINR